MQDLLVPVRGTHVPSVLGSPSARQIPDGGQEGKGYISAAVKCHGGVPLPYRGSSSRGTQFQSRELMVLAKGT